MSDFSRSVSIHPYFKVQPGKLDEFKALFPEFVARTATEDACHFYDFSINGDVVFCRESYADGAAALKHIENVGDLLAKGLTISDLLRIEFHGPAAELEIMKEPLASLNAEWFEIQ